MHLHAFTIIYNTEIKSSPFRRRKSLEGAQHFPLSLSQIENI